MSFQHYSTDEILTAAREGSALVKQSEATLIKLRVGKNALRKHIEVILKSDTGYDIVLRTCDEITTYHIQSLIDTVKDDNITKDIKKEAKDYCKDVYKFNLDDIVAFGKLERELTKSKFESYIEHVIINGDGFDKQVSKKAYKCFANETNHSHCTCSNVIHEDAGSSFNCLISTKLKFYNWGVIYKHYKS